MLKNNILLAFRNILKRKSFALINILGLTIGMTVCFLILIYARFEMSYDRFHPYADDIYRVSVDMYVGGAFQVSDAQCYPAVGPMTMEEFPEIENFAMARNVGRLLLKNGQQAYNENRAYFANSGWLEVFDWQMIRGDRKTALNDVGMMVITESLAHKYFGEENAMGQTLAVVSDAGEIPLKVNGIIKDVPENAHLKFDVLISYETGVEYIGMDRNSWSGNNEFLYLQTNGSPLEDNFSERLNQAFKVKVADNREEKLIVQPLTDIHLNSDKTYEADVNGSQAMVNILLVVALFVLVIAWVNYINLSTAKALERGKEVGVRKVLGSSRFSLFIQFLTEAFLLNFLSLILTITCIQGALPLFNELAGINLSLSFISDQKTLWLVLIIFLVGSFASGVYPAVVLANYKPLSVLKGKLKDSRSGILLRKGLVVFQFLITMVLLSGTLIIYRQVQHMRTKELGIDIDRTIVIRTPIVALSEADQAQKRDVFQNELNRKSWVEGVSYSGTIFGQGTNDMSASTGISRVGNQESKGINYYFYTVDDQFVQTFGFKVLAGRSFDKKLEVPFEDTDRQFQGLMINEMARKLLGFETNEAAIGQKIDRWERIFTVIGVFNDYNHHSLKSGVDPTILFYDRDGIHADYTSIKISGNETSEKGYKSALPEIESTYRDVYPESDFDFFFLDDQFNKQYKADQQFGVVFGLFSSITVLVSILGLFGLILYEIQQRIKEIGIRKVLGAETMSIITMLSSHFIKLILVSIFLAVPLVYYGGQKWLNGYIYHIGLSWFVFVVPALVILFIALFTIVLQCLKVAYQNPVDALRYE